MSDPKSSFLSGIGQAAAEAVSENTPPAATVFETWWNSKFPRYDQRSYSAHLGRTTWEAAQSSLASQLSAMESAKNAAMTLAHEREAEIKRLERELADAKRERNESDAALAWIHHDPTGENMYGRDELRWMHEAVERHRAALAPLEPK